MVTSKVTATVHTWNLYQCYASKDILRDLPSPSEAVKLIIAIGEVGQCVLLQQSRKISCVFIPGCCAASPAHILGKLPALLLQDQQPRSSGSLLCAP